MDRRTLLMGLSGGAALGAAPGLARGLERAGPPALVSGSDIHLHIDRRTLVVDSQPLPAIAINGSTPGPLIRLTEGQHVRLHVHNGLDEDSSIHWHGLLVPPQFDGVPGVSFPGIGPGQTFTYAFTVRQAGTYWYHSHSGLQEQLGHHGPLVIDPLHPVADGAQREHIVFLSDHSALAPEAIFRRLKLEPGYFNRQKQTLAGLLAGRDQPLAERLRWGAMRMDPTDIADVTATAYHYLVNGRGAADNWTGLFEPGERVRLRVINGSAMTVFNLRIPDLELTVVQADGQDVRPVVVDELQIGVAETYDLIVAPQNRAYAIIAENIDRSGMARATLAPRPGMAAPVPPLRRRPLATDADMGMGGHSGGGRMDMNHGAMDHGAMDHGAMDHGGAKSMPGSAMSMRDFSRAPGVDRNAGVQSIAMAPVDRTGEPGQGLEDAGHRVLTYRDLVAPSPGPDQRAPARSIDIHLTGSMERFMWSFDGVRMSDSMEPLRLRADERVRVRLINDTMMGHPIHLHGHFFELVTGHGAHAPRKHTVLVKPGGIVTFDLTADAVGDWAFHCHLLYHMAAGMMRIVSIRRDGQA